MLLTYCHYSAQTSQFTDAVLRAQRLVVEDLTSHLVKRLLEVWAVDLTFDDRDVVHGVAIEVCVEHCGIH